MAIVNGTWRFNEVPSLSSTEIVQKGIVFTPPLYEGSTTTYTGIKVTSASILCLNPNAGDGVGVWWSMYPQESGDWGDGAYRIVDFGATEQEVSDEFYEWFTANATQQASEEETPEETPIATITYKGETLETLNGGEYVTLHTKGKTMEDDIRVEVEEVSGGDIAINGIVEQYKVNAGATVNAGDFVEFVNKCGTGAFCEHTDDMSVCKLDNSRILVAYNDLNESGCCKVVVLSFGEDAVKVGIELKLSSVPVNNISAVATSSDKVVVVYSTKTTPIRNVVVIALSVEDIHLKSWEGSTLASFGEVTIYKTLVVSLSSEKVLIFYSYSTDNSRYIYCCPVTLDGVGIIKEGSYKVPTGSASSSISPYFSAAALSEDSVLIVYSWSATLHDYAYAHLISVTDTVVSFGAQYTFAERDFRYVSVVPLSENRAMVVFAYSNNTKYEGCAVMLSVGSSGSISAGLIRGLGTVNYISAAALSSEKVVVSYADSDTRHATVDFVYDNGNGYPIHSRSGVYFPAVTTKNDIVAFSPSSALVIHNSSGGLYTCLTIDDNTFAIDGAGTYVQPATSRLHNVGIAKTSGTEGQMVDVYCVGGESV